MGSYDIGPLTQRWAAQMAAIERRCFSMPWSESMILDELRGEHGLYLAAVSGDTLLGYAGAQIILDEGYITNIATHPDHRRRGVADALLKALIAAAATRDVRFLTLEVRRLNRAARLLYERNGFVVVGVRPGYYERPKEDAILYTLMYNEHKEEP